MASLVVGPALAEWRHNRITLHPARFVLGRLAEDIAYGTGVWAGSIRNSTTRRAGSPDPLATLPHHERK